MSGGQADGLSTARPDTACAWGKEKRTVGLRLPHDRQRRPYGQVAKLTAADAADGDMFGRSVAIDGPS